MLPSIPVIGPACLEKGCSDCCEDTEMVLTQADVERITAFTDLDQDAFAFRADDGFLQLRTQEDAKRSCYFLKEQHCSIFDVRPEGCRLYPAFLDEDRVVLDALHCPHTEAFQLTKQVEASVTRLARRLEQEAD